MSAPSTFTTDTPASVHERMVERWRSMSSIQRFEMVTSLNDSCEQLWKAGVRARHPSADEDGVRLRVIALRPGRDLMVEVYGWDPAVEGW